MIASNGIVAESGNPALGHEEFALRLHARRNLEIDETVDLLRMIYGNVS